MPIEPRQISSATPGQPTGPPQQDPPEDPQPEVPPVQEPGEPSTPDELPGGMPDEFPVRGPFTPGPETDATNAEAQGKI